jgi:hypothetical protein
MCGSYVHMLYCVERHVDMSQIIQELYVCNGPTNALVCNKTLLQMSHIKTFKITTTCFDHQLITIAELYDPG